MWANIKISIIVILLVTPAFIFHDLKEKCGNSLAVQWLGLGTLTAGAQVPSLARELRSCKPRSVVKFFFKIKICLLLVHNK